MPSGCARCCSSPAERTHHGYAPPSPGAPAAARSALPKSAPSTFSHSAAMSVQLPLEHGHEHIAAAACRWGGRRGEYRPWSGAARGDRLLLQPTTNSASAQTERARGKTPRSRKQHRIHIIKVQGDKGRSTARYAADERGRTRIGREHPRSDLLGTSSCVSKTRSTAMNNHGRHGRHDSTDDSDSCTEPDRDARDAMFRFSSRL